MGRTYSFEPFKAQQPAQTYQGSGPRLGNDEHELALSQDKAQHATPPKAAATYGQAHSETVKRYRSRAQARKRAGAEKKATTRAKPVAKKTVAKKTAAKKTVAKAAPRRPAVGKPPAHRQAEEKAATRKSTAAPLSLKSVGRKVLTRAAAAAKKTMARAVKTTTSRKPAKKR